MKSTTANLDYASVSIQNGNGILHQLPLIDAGTPPAEAAQMITSNDEHYQFHALPGIIRHARNYIAKMPEAVSGEGGHSATFSVACKLVQGFGLDFDDALHLLLEYNERCDPPWLLAELEHKINDALAAPVDDRGEAYLLKDLRGPQQGELPFVKDRRPFSMEDALALTKVRRIPPHGLIFAASKKFLFRTTWYDLECFGVSDSSGLLIELRRMDGLLFPAVPAYNLDERKSHTVRGSKKSWPLGMLEADRFPCIALVEGVPDFLYAHLRVVDEGARDRVAVVGMLSSSPGINQEALPHFEGKRVRIFPHLDEAGLKGARKWKTQLEKAGAKEVDLFDFSGLVGPDGTQLNDLCDLTKLTPAQMKADSTLRSLLP